MNRLDQLYGGSLALLTDLYQLTMAYGYWKSGQAERRAAFHLFFRRNPFDGGYALACGLETVIDYLERWRFSPHDLSYLAEVRGNDDKPLFSPEFLDYLGRMKLECNLDALPEGTAVFPHEPLLRVTGPILQCQLLETPLLTIINFQTLIATKASRVCYAARGEPVLEFGLRRAQGIDGGLTASRAAYVGGCVATSNVLAGKLYGIPVKGTHAHSWVMFFPDEISSFRAYAEAMPNNCVFLVDTYDSIEGVRNAIEVGKELRARGHELLGVRLDSGDLAHLSIEARQLLDEGGFPNAQIVASNNLDEHVIQSLEEQGAQIGIWGVGTKLATGYDQPALGGVYKLTAVQSDAGQWEPRVKLSEQAIKISTPGLQQVRRYYDGDHMVADCIHDTELGVTDPSGMYDIEDPTRRRPLPEGAAFRDLLVPIFESGALRYQRPSIAEIRAHAAAELESLGPRTRRLLNPHLYPVGLEPALHRRKLELVARARKQKEVIP